MWYSCFYLSTGKLLHVCLLTVAPLFVHNAGLKKINKKTSSSPEGQKFINIYSWAGKLTQLMCELLDLLTGKKKNVANFPLSWDHISVLSCFIIKCEFPWIKVAHGHAKQIRSKISQVLTTFYGNISEKHSKKEAWSQ